MYDKLYKEIFLKSFVRYKKKVFQCKEKNVSIWKIRIYQQIYFVTVYLDDIDDILTADEKKQKIKEFERRNEAELTHFRTEYGENSTEKRIVANRLFLELIRKYSKEATI